MKDQINLKDIPLSQLRAHDKNPRLVMRQDVVDAIVANLESGFDPAHALIARPVEDYYQIISGHHRKAAAEKAGLETVPCWIREMSDEDAYMALATSNSQGELSPLEIGLHALNCVSLGNGGRGKKGGLSEYAEKIGKDPSNVSKLVNAAKVLKNHGNVTTVFDDKVFHLAALHALPQSCWTEAVETLLKKGWSAKETAEQVKTANQGSTDKRKIALLSGRTSLRELARIDELRDKVMDFLEFPESRQEWLEWLEQDDPLDIKQVQAKRIELEDKEAAIKTEQDNQIEAPKLPSLVLADPPWRYDFSQSDSRQIENQYPSATVDEIISHRPETDKDCVLFLWATVAKLPQALEVMEGWGFEYKTHAVWDKEKIGMGYWFRGQHELILVGTKGSASPPNEANRVSSVFRQPREAHSAKPECVYTWLESAFPHALKLEMYCRSPRKNWLVFGNESAKAAA